MFSRRLRRERSPQYGFDASALEKIKAFSGIAIGRARFIKYYFVSL